ncbi:hypothetical protein B0T18DRAFT_430565 [Schizothecium vesticola]|uniref:Uncharacterized protein n=1 Tax=Schizothecium vesticola TaxID=314040 RepID=A0AA40EPR1_9PEZI|nr:hypothetical protein B0T18DRAFT_430565 [Schizothecium vesticola]
MDDNGEGDHGDLGDPTLPSSPVKDKSPIPGLSKLVVVQICFRIGELVNRASKCRSANQDAIFELYARVKSSSRDSSGRVQHFEFMDLFKSYPPHLAGTLSGWKRGSLVDEQSAAFLAITDPKMCRCICKMRRVTKGKHTSWVLEVMSIRETVWDNVDWIKATAFRGQ